MIVERKPEDVLFAVKIEPWSSETRIEHLGIKNKTNSKMSPLFVIDTSLQTERLF